MTDNDKITVLGLSFRKVTADDITAFECPIGSYKAETEDAVLILHPDRKKISEFIPYDDLESINERVWVLDAELNSWKK